MLGPVFAPSLRLRRGSINKNQFYDTLTYEIMHRSLTATSVCIDVGCHEGSILRGMMKLAPNGRFYAFEPLPQLYDKLKVSFPFPEVRLFNLALSNQTGVVTFNHVISNPGYSGILKRKYDRPEETDCTISVSADRLDNVIDTGEDVGFIKIDVEGAELQVLQGAIDTIRRCKPIIVFEHGLGAADCYGTTPDQVYGLLCDDCGLNISLLDSWLKDRKPLSQVGFREQFEKGMNFMFIAHPI